MEHTKNKNNITNSKTDNTNQTLSKRDIFDIEIDEKISNLEIFISFIIFFFVFVVFMPYIMLKNKYFNLLEVYIPNLDMIANLFSFHGGVLPNNLFLYLYNPIPTNLGAFLSQTAINYIVLLGITYIVARETKQKNSISWGWSTGFFMILITYLLPNQFISNIMTKTYKYFNKDDQYLIFKHNASFKNRFYSYFPSFFVGLICVILVILFERLLLKNFRSYVEKIADYFLKFIKTNF